MSLPRLGDRSSSPQLPSALPRTNSPKRDLDRRSSVESASEYVASDNQDETTGTEVRASPSDQEDRECLEEEFTPPPNKFRGPSYTWRVWTAADRAVSRSLDQLKAQDLGLHLYNVHALKQTLKEKRTRRDRSILQDGEDWEVPRMWTAWPMNATQVPRGDNRIWGKDGADEMVLQSIGGPPTSRADLEDLLLGVTLRQARKKFLRRKPSDEVLEAQVSDKTTESLENNSAIRSLNGSNELLEKSQASSINDSHTSLSSYSGEDSLTSSAHSRISDMSLTDERITDPDHEPILSNSSTVTRSRLIPVVMADDEEAERILQPSIRHILANLDELLSGLHHCRETQSSLQDGSLSETQTETSEVDLVSEPEPRSRRRQRSTSVQIRRKIRNSIHPIDTDASQPPSTRPRSRVFKKQHHLSSSASRNRYQRGCLNLRDWSDILGTASLTGFPPAVIEAAVARCAALFNEGMNFRTLSADQKSQSLDTAILPTGIFPQSPSTPDPAFSSKDHVLRQAYNQKGQLICPVTTCRRSARPFNRKWNLDKHMLEAHREAGIMYEGSEDEMEGGVHVDGFLRPIKVRQGWRYRGREKGTNWKRKGNEKGD